MIPKPASELINDRKTLLSSAVSEVSIRSQVQLYVIQLGVKLDYRKLSKKEKKSVHLQLLYANHFFLANIFWKESTNRD